MSVFPNVPGVPRRKMERWNWCPTKNGLQGSLILKQTYFNTFFFHNIYNSCRFNGPGSALRPQYPVAILQVEIKGISWHTGVKDLQYPVCQLFTGHIGFKYLYHGLDCMDGRGIIS
jgi:hypothetical protein